MPKNLMTWSVADKFTITLVSFVRIGKTQVIS